MSRESVNKIPVLAGENMR